MSIAGSYSIADHCHQYAKFVCMISFIHFYEHDYVRRKVEREGFSFTPFRAVPPQADSER